MTLNFRRGVFRLWLVSTFAWLAFVTFEHKDEISYSMKYLIQRDALVAERKSWIEFQIYRLQEVEANLKAEDAERKSKADIERLSEYGQKLTKMGIVFPAFKSNPKLLEVQQELEERQKEQPTPQEPNVENFLVAAVIPFVVLLIYALLKPVLIWVAVGFRRQ